MPILAATLLLLLVGCGEPAIDGSSEDDFYRSAGRMTLSLPAEKRDDFSDALMLVTMDGMDFTADPVEGKQLDFEAAIERLDGMTVEDVFARAEELQGHPE